jgi:hypothetical protein
VPHLNGLNVVFLARDRLLALGVQTLDHRKANRASAFAEALGEHMLAAVRRSTTKHAGTSNHAGQSRFHDEFRSGG